MLYASVHLKPYFKGFVKFATTSRRQLEGSRRIFTQDALSRHSAHGHVMHAQPVPPTRAGTPPTGNRTRAAECLNPTATPFRPENILLTNHFL